MPAAEVLERYIARVEANAHAEAIEEFYTANASMRENMGAPRVGRDVLVARELASGTLLKPFDLSMPGYCFYVVRRHGHPREKAIQAFSTWVQTAI